LYELASFSVRGSLNLPSSVPTTCSAPKLETATVCQFERQRFVPFAPFFGVSLDESLGARRLHQGRVLTISSGKRWFGASSLMLPPYLMWLELQRKCRLLLALQGESNTSSNSIVGAAGRASIHWKMSTNHRGAQNWRRYRVLALGGWVVAAHVAVGEAIQRRGYADSCR
jgi:hypothetical protein